MAAMVRASPRFLAIYAVVCLALSTTTGAQEKLAYPTSAPHVRPAKRIVFVAENFKNGGIVAVYRGLEAATRSMGWQLDIVDGAGQFDKQTELFDKVIAAHPNAIVIGGFDATKFAAQVAAAKKAKIVLVGWHAAKDPGPTSTLFVNVATSADDVGRIAADFVIQDAKAKGIQLGVVIFNDDQFAVANAKVKRMQKAIEACDSCKVLAVENVQIAHAEQAMEDVVSKLARRYGSAWTHSLAINDIYFDQIDETLGRLKRKDILNVSGGDGSAMALARIESGSSQQIGSVAEPLKLQGYQLADELNRAFAGAPPSGFKSRPILVNRELLKATGKHGVESTLGFEAAYMALWSKK